MPSSPHARTIVRGLRGPVLTEADWRRLEPLLKNIEPRRQLAAYNRLVMGWPLVDAGAHASMSKQDVAMVVKAVLRWWDRLHEVPEEPQPPPGWVALHVHVPRHRVDDVRRVVDALCGPMVTGKNKR